MWYNGIERGERMDRTESLYLMISRTEGGMGKLIRCFTRYEYNHVSLTLDPTLSSWVSFARYRCNMPLYGGYINESSERLLAGGGHVPVRIFRIAITPEKRRRLERLFSAAGDPDSGMIYNHFDALATTVGRSVRIPDAYTCLGFAGRVLEQRFRNIRELDEELSDCLVYSGRLGDVLQDSGSREDEYFTRMRIVPGTWATLRHMAKLSVRAVLR